MTILKSRPILIVDHLTISEPYWRFSHRHKCRCYLVAVPVETAGSWEVFVIVFSDIWYKIQEENQNQLGLLNIFIQVKEHNWMLFAQLHHAVHLWRSIFFCYVSPVLYSVFSPLVCQRLPMSVVAQGGFFLLFFFGDPKWQVFVYELWALQWKSELPSQFVCFISQTAKIGELSEGK